MFIHLRLNSGSVYLPCTLSVWYDKRLSKNVNARLNIRLNYSSTSSARISNMVGYTIRPRTLLRTTRGDVWRREGMAPRILNICTKRRWAVRVNSWILKGSCSLWEEAAIWWLLFGEKIVWIRVWTQTDYSHVGWRPFRLETLGRAVFSGVRKITVVR